MAVVVASEDINAEMDLFQTNVVQSAIVSEDTVSFFPVAPISANQPLQFEIPESHTQMTHPIVMLKVVVKITKLDGSKVEANKKVAPCNLFLHSLFKDVTLTANGTVLQRSNGLYPYRAYVETNFTYSAIGKEGFAGAPQVN